MNRLAFVVALLGIVAGGGACGGGGGGSDAPPYRGPTNVLLFSAREADGAYGLYSLAAEAGAQPQRITREAAPIASLRWSPDGTRLAYTTGEGESIALRAIELESRDTATASESVPAASASPAAWSPDGAELAYIDAADGGSLRFYDVAAASTLESRAVPATEVDWSSGGDLAVVNDGDLLRVDRDSGEGELLADEPEAIAGPRWSPDGETVAFWSGREPQLAIVQPGGRPRGLGRGWQPSWTGDGARLAFAYEVQTGASDIYTVDVEPAGTPAQLTTSITFDQWPSWSPDGTRVAYIAAADATTAFVCMAQFGSPGGECPELPGGLLPSEVVWSLR